MIEKEPGSGGFEPMILSIISKRPRTVIKEAGVVKKTIRIIARIFKANLFTKEICESLLRFFHEISSGEGAADASTPYISSSELMRENSKDSVGVL